MNEVQTAWIFFTVLTISLNYGSHVCVRKEEMDLKCTNGSKPENVPICDVLKVYLNVTCVILVHNENISIKEADMFVSMITKCEVKLLYVSEGENQSPNISTQQIMEDMKFDCAQIHLTQRAVTSFQSLTPPAFNCSLRQPIQDVINRSIIQSHLEILPPLRSEVALINGFLRFKQTKHFITTTQPFVLMHEKKEGPNGTVIYYGIFFDFLNTLAKHLNFEYTVKEPEDQTWGAIDENGEWSGMIGQIIRKEVDFGSGGFTITKSRSEVVDFMVPWWEGSVTFMVKLRGDEAFSLYLRPFKYETWIVVACTVLVAGLTLIFLHKMSRYSTTYNKRKRMKYKSILETKGKLADARANPHMLHTYGYMLNQGCRQKSTKPSARIFISCYWILTITITATYSGNLIAFMTVKKVKVPINSLRELVENPDYQAGVAFGGSTHGLFKEAKSGTYKEVWDKSINVNPNNFYIRGNRYKETLPALKRVQEEKFVYISDSIHSFGVISKSGVCDVTMAKERFYKVGYGLPAQKGFQYLQMFNKGILAIQEAGLFKKWQQIHWRFGENQCDNSLSSVGHSPTNLLNTVGMYFALATGIGVAFVVLLTEILVKYVLTHRIKTLSSLGLYEKFGFSS